MSARGGNLGWRRDPWQVEEVRAMHSRGSITAEERGEAIERLRRARGTERDAILAQLRRLVAG